MLCLGLVMLHLVERGKFAMQRNVAGMYDVETFSQDQYSFHLFSLNVGARHTGAVQVCHVIFVTTQYYYNIYLAFTVSPVFQTAFIPQY